MSEIIDNKIATYTEADFETLDPLEHIRRRPGMYIGKLGDGSQNDDGIYVLIKEVVDNSIDEFVMGNGKQIDIALNDKKITVRDYGRGIPLGKLDDAVSKMNTGAKYGSEAFKKSVGLNGVGLKAVNALSSSFVARAVRDGQARTINYEYGIAVNDLTEMTPDRNGTMISFVPDEDTKIFANYNFNCDYIETMLKNYSYLNSGLTMKFNGVNYLSKNGLLDLLTESVAEEYLYPPIHLRAEDIELAISHSNGYNESYYSFVNGQHTTQGGTHQAAMREAIVKVIREFYKKDFDPADIRASIVAAISIKVVEPIFESQTKTKLGSKDIAPGGNTIRSFVGDFMKAQLDNFLHKNPVTADILHKKILAAEKERKAISGVQKKAREFAKKASLHNKKLRDCKVHLGNKDPRNEQSSIFITEGDSASGSITKSRDVATQAVFSLKGKPLNTYGLTKKVVYENEEFNLLQAALNIEEDMENLRYNKVIIATDADVDGMHIRLLLLTFFLQFFPDVIRGEHLYILQTPLFRVRNKKQTIYCYTEQERLEALKKLGANPEITRFKGLGEISPHEFKEFIGENIRLEKVKPTSSDTIQNMLEFYMGKNTAERQDFIIDNLKVEEEIA